MKNIITIEARRFPVVIKDAESGEVKTDTITLNKEQLQASMLVGQSSKELIHRIYQRNGFQVLDIGKPQKKTVSIDLDTLWEE